jgi:hypothetical protein
MNKDCTCGAFLIPRVNDLLTNHVLLVMGKPKSTRGISTKGQVVRMFYRVFVSALSSIKGKSEYPKTTWGPSGDIPR